MFDIHSFDVPTFDRILSKGLSSGLGQPDSQMCIEAAICQTLGLPHGDDPGCVTESVRQFKIRLNDARWPTPEDRAAGLRDLGLAQLGSKGVVNNKEFAVRMAKKTVRQLLSALFRELANGRQSWLDAADRCEREGTTESARAAQRLAAAAAAAAAAADAPFRRLFFLNLSASLALETLRELNSPGIALLDRSTV